MSRSGKKRNQKRKRRSSNTRDTSKVVNNSTAGDLDDEIYKSQSSMDKSMKEIKDTANSQDGNNKASTSGDKVSEKNREKSRTVIKGKFNVGEKNEALKSSTEEGVQEKIEKLSDNNNSDNTPSMSSSHIESDGQVKENVRLEIKEISCYDADNAEISISSKNVSEVQMIEDSIKKKRMVSCNEYHYCLSCSILNSTLSEVPEAKIISTKMSSNDSDNANALNKTESKVREKEKCYKIDMKGSSKDTEVSASSIKVSGDDVEKEKSNEVLTFREELVKNTSDEDIVEGKYSKKDACTSIIKEKELKEEKSLRLEKINILCDYVTSYDEFSTSIYKVSEMYEEELNNMARRNEPFNDDGNDKKNASSNIQANVKEEISIHMESKDLTESNQGNKEKSNTVSVILEKKAGDVDFQVAAPESSEIGTDIKENDNIIIVIEELPLRESVDCEACTSKLNASEVQEEEKRNVRTRHTCSKDDNNTDSSLENNVPNNQEEKDNEGRTGENPYNNNNNDDFSNNGKEVREAPFDSIGNFEASTSIEINNKIQNIVYCQNISEPTSAAYKNDDKTSKSVCLTTEKVRRTNLEEIVEELADIVKGYDNHLNEDEIATIFRMIEKKIVKSSENDDGMEHSKSSENVSKGFEENIITKSKSTSYSDSVTHVTFITSNRTNTVMTEVQTDQNNEIKLRKSSFDNSDKDKVTSLSNTFSEICAAEKYWTEVRDASHNEGDNTDEGFVLRNKVLGDQIKNKNTKTNIEEKSYIDGSYDTDYTASGNVTEFGNKKENDTMILKETIWNDDRNDEASSTSNKIPDCHKEDAIQEDNKRTLSKIKINYDDVSGGSNNAAAGNEENELNMGEQKEWELLKRRINNEIDNEFVRMNEKKIVESCEDDGGIKYYKSSENVSEDSEENIKTELKSTSYSDNVSRETSVTSNTTNKIVTEAHTDENNENKLRKSSFDNSYNKDKVSSFSNTFTESLVEVRDASHNEGDNTDEGFILRNKVLEDQIGIKNTETNIEEKSYIDSSYDTDYPASDNVPKFGKEKENNKMILNETTRDVDRNDEASSNSNKIPDFQKEDEILKDSISTLSKIKIYDEDNGGVSNKTAAGNENKELKIYNDTDYTANDNEPEIGTEKENDRLKHNETTCDVDRNDEASSTSNKIPDYQKEDEIQEENKGTLAKINDDLDGGVLNKTAAENKDKEEQNKSDLSESCINKVNNKFVQNNTSADNSLKNSNEDWSSMSHSSLLTSTPKTELLKSTKITTEVNIVNLLEELIELVKKISCSSIIGDKTLTSSQFLNESVDNETELRRRSFNEADYNNDSLICNKVSKTQKKEEHNGTDVKETTCIVESQNKEEEDSKSSKNVSQTQDDELKKIEFKNECMSNTDCGKNTISKSNNKLSEAQEGEKDVIRETPCIDGFEHEVSTPQDIGRTDTGEMSCIKSHNSFVFNENLSFHYDDNDHKASIHREASGSSSIISDDSKEVENRSLEIGECDRYEFLKKLVQEIRMGEQEMSYNDENPVKYSMLGNLMEDLRNELENRNGLKIRDTIDCDIDDNESLAEDQIVKEEEELNSKELRKRPNSDIDDEDISAINRKLAKVSINGNDIERQRLGTSVFVENSSFHYDDNDNEASTSTNMISEYQNKGERNRKKRKERSPDPNLGQRQINSSNTRNMLLEEGRSYRSAIVNTVRNDNDDNEVCELSNAEKKRSTRRETFRRTIARIQQEIRKENRKKLEDISRNVKVMDDLNNVNICDTEVYVQVKGRSCKVEISINVL